LASKPWTEVWPQVRAAVRESRTRLEACEKVSTLREEKTTWDALARQWRRLVEQGEEKYGADVELGQAEDLKQFVGLAGWIPDTKADDGTLCGLPVLSAEEIDDMPLKLPTTKARGVGGKPTVLVAPADGDRWLIPGDLHFGIQDSVSIELMQQCAEDFGVTDIALQGDTFDCYAISRHDQRAARIRGQCYTLAEEREEGRTRYLPGNHEDRTWTVADKNPGLHGSLDLRTVFDIPEEIEVLDQFGRIQAGPLVIEHGHKLPGSLGRYGVNRALADHPDQTTIFGHTHRIAEARHTSYDREGRPRTRMALTIGHLSVAAKHVDYAPDANWQQGFALVEFWKGNGNKTRFTVYMVEIHDHEFTFMGKHYG
jgi:hypothetical protein